MNSAAIQRRFSNIRNIAPKTVSCTWSSEAFTGIRSEVRSEVKYSNYGYETGVEFLVMVPKDEIGATSPQKFDDITVDSVAKRIVDNVREDPTGSEYIIPVGDERG